MRDPMRSLLTTGIRSKQVHNYNLIQKYGVADAAPFDLKMEDYNNEFSREIIKN